MSTKLLKSVDKSFLTARGNVSPYKYTASIESSISKGRKPSEDHYKLHYETHSSFFPQRQDKRDLTSRKKLIVDPKTGRLCYPSLLFQKKALKESIKKSLSKGSVVRGDSEEDEVEEVKIEDTAKEVVNTTRYARETGRDENRQYMAFSRNTETRESALYHHSDAEEVSSAAEGEAEDNELLENRKYSMYEDWRIIETIDEQIRENGVRGYLSKALWKTLIDPMTGSRLLDGTRTPESMRERYKRWLVLLTEEDKEELRRFARKHTEAELKNSCCAFKKVDSKRMFNGVSEDAMDTYSTLKFINTPRKSSSKTMPQSVRYTEEKPAVPQIFVTKPGDENLVRERLVFTESKADKKRRDVAEISRINTVKKSPAKEKEVISTLKRLYIPVDDDDVETVEKQRILDAEKLNKRNDQGEFRPRSKKIQKIFETPETGKVNFREIPRGKRLDFSQINLKDKLNYNLKGRKYIIEDFSKSEDEEQGVEEGIKQRPMDLNLSVCVDMNKMRREFVKEKDEKRGRNNIKLIKVAEKYGLKLDDALRLFNAVSGDYEDLKLYLQKGDVNLLWTEDDDHGLILNNKTAIRYLKVIKGEKRMERRKMYLLGRYERRRRASQSAL